MPNPAMARMHVRVMDAPLLECVPRRGPLRAEILAHIERAGHLVALQLSGKAVGESGAVDLADVARDPHVVAGNRAGEVAGRKVALMGPRELITLLLHVEGVVGRAGGELDAHIPAAGQVSRGRPGRLGFPLRAFGGEDLVDTV